ncbi:hypothetical protein Tco_0353085 [Tanacetum coccineum]
MLKPKKCSGEADLLKDTSGPEPSLELWRSWCVEGYVRRRGTKFQRNPTELDIHHCCGHFYQAQAAHEPQVLVTCRSRQMELLGDETDIVPLFGVEYWVHYNNEDDPIPIRRRVFSSAKDGLMDRRGVPDWILRCWSSLYATQPKKYVDRKTYLIFGFTWAFKMWILESFRVGANDYYERQRRYPRVVAWSSKRKFYRHMLHGFFHGRLPIERSTPDENILNQERREVRPNMYRRTPYMDLPPTTVLPKKRGDKTTNKVKSANVSPLNLGNIFADDNVGGDDIMFLGEHDTSN